MTLETLPVLKEAFSVEKFEKSKAYILKNIERDYDKKSELVMIEGTKHVELYGKEIPYLSFNKNFNFKHIKNLPEDCRYFPGIEFLPGVSIDSLFFKYAVINNAVFRGVTLTGENSFEKADCRSVDFSYAIINHTYFDYADISNSIFCKGTLRDVSFANANLTGVKFENEVLNEVIFINANVDSCSFDKKTSQRYVNLVEAKNSHKVIGLKDFPQYKRKY